MLKSKLKVLLALHDMTQSDLSAQTGIRPGTITAIVNNQIKQIPVDAANKICALFKCDIGDIWEYIPDQPRDNGISND